MRALLMVSIAAGLAACVPSSPPPAERVRKDAGVAGADAAVMAPPPQVVQLCDPVHQTVCGGDEACVWSVEDDSAQCQVPTSLAALGDPCNADEPSCSAGYTCTALRNDEGTTCYAVCDPRNDMVCPMHSTANRIFVCMPLAGLSFGLCALAGSNCDPLQPATCGEEETCTLFGGQTSCVRAGDVQAGADCTEASCARGLMCTKLSDRRTPVCLKPCDTGSPSCTGGSDVCTGLEGLSFGVCQPTSAECTPLADNCGADRACAIAGTTVVCQAPGPAAIGADCSTDACARGGVCARVVGEPNPTCREPCDLGLPRCASPTAECNDIGLRFGICK